MIEVRALTKTFGTLAAVDDLSFTVERGQVVGFLGPNGAGKTTTLRMLLGLVRPTAGIATIDGVRYRELAEPLHTVGAVLEASGFHPGRTARDHLRIHARAAHVDQSRIGEVLQLVDLASAGNRRVGGYSLGMRQRLGLATALLCGPQVLVLDEPANGLDPEGVRWLRSLLRQLANDGAAVLVSSHILAEIAQTADSVIILDHGRLITQSRLDELAGELAPTVRVRTPEPRQLQELLTGQGATASTVDGWLHVSGATPEQIGTLAAARSLPIFETRVETPDLEDVFLQLTGGATREQSR